MGAMPKIMWKVYQMSHCITDLISVKISQT